jgi:hypothetical protein
MNKGDKDKKGDKKKDEKGKSPDKKKDEKPKRYVAFFC